MGTDKAVRDSKAELRTVQIADPEISYLNLTLWKYNFRVKGHRDLGVGVKSGCAYRVLT